MRAGTADDGALERVRWIHGAPDCASADEPPLQAHWYDAHTVVLRQGKCSHSEAPFLYLLIGRERALLVDTGAAPGDGAAPLPLRETVDAALARAAGPGGTPADLVVAHSHGHDDHLGNDAQFAGRPATTVVPASLAAVCEHFALRDWPNGTARVELGGRALLVVPTPGHEEAHVMFYDERTGLLLSGDMLYPGLLTVRDWPAFRASAARVAALAAARPPRHVLGCHVEMRRTPRQWYPLGTRYQPDEHALPLSAAHVAELHRACERLGERLRVDVHDDFVITPPL